MKQELIIAKENFENCGIGGHDFEICKEHKQVCGRFLLKFRALFDGGIQGKFCKEVIVDLKNTIKFYNENKI